MQGFEDIGSGRTYLNSIEFREKGGPPANHSPAITFGPF
jgi:hypothetical protein